MKFQLTIARKLIGLSVLSVFFMAAVGFSGSYARHFLTVGANRVLAAQEVLRLQMQMDQARAALRADVLGAQLAAQQFDRDQSKVIAADLQAHATELATGLGELQELELDPATRAAMDKLRPTLQAHATQAKAIVDLALANRAAETRELEDFLGTSRRLEGEMRALGDLTKQQARAAEAESRRTSQRIGYVVRVGVTLAGLVLLFAAWAISRNIVRRIQRAVQVARTVATGDLSSRIHVQGDDEAAQLLGALASMNDNLVQLVHTVRQSSENIASGSVQIANGNQDLSQRTEEQASNLQQTAASMEQISANVRANADSTREASEVAALASQSAARSGDAVQKLVATMGGITASSRRITDITGVIDAIAFQTNILALNAAVEAARAGDQGRGFAVVAAEVRTLAQRSATAAKEIKSLIESSVAQVNAGEKEAAHAGTCMDDAMQQVRRVTTLLAEIRSATQEQNKGMAEVSQAVTQIDQVTQSNASLVEEAAAAAESLSRQAARLVDAVSQFRIEGDQRTSLTALPA